MSDRPRILILGVGNVLLKDEGVGVHVVNHLNKAYAFSSNVTVLDGGTLGMRLLDSIGQADRLIVVDVALRDGAPGTVYRITGDAVMPLAGPKNSMHQASVAETLTYASMLGTLPPTVIVAIEPEDMSPWGTEPTPHIQECMPALISAVLDEVRLAGGSARLTDDSAASCAPLRASECPVPQERLRTH
jgi:hydrogenase maturation protease